MRRELPSTSANQGNDAISRELIVQHVVGASMAVVGWWLDGGTKLPAEQVDASFRRLVTEGLHGVVKAAVEPSESSSAP